MLCFVSISFLFQPLSDISHLLDFHPTRLLPLRPSVSSFLTLVFFSPLPIKPKNSNWNSRKQTEHINVFDDLKMCVAIDITFTNRWMRLINKDISLINMTWAGPFVNEETSNKRQFVISDNSNNNKNYTKRYICGAINTLSCHVHISCRTISVGIMSFDLSWLILSHWKRRIQAFHA